MIGTSIMEELSSLQSALGNKINILFHYFTII